MMTASGSFGGSVPPSAGRTPSVVKYASVTSCACTLSVEIGRLIGRGRKPERREVRERRLLRTLEILEHEHRDRAEAAIGLGLDVRPGDRPRGTAADRAARA